MNVAPHADPAGSLPFAEGVPDSGEPLLRRVRSLLQTDASPTRSLDRQLLEKLCAGYETALQRNHELERHNESLQRALISASGRHAFPATPPRSLRVLLVDDDPSLLEALRTGLQDEGHRVHTAAGGQAGIDAFRSALMVGTRFDVVITDLVMPYVDGRQVAAEVRTLSPATPIIVLTGWGQQALNQERPLQVDRVLGKPPRIRELRAALAELIAARSAAAAR